MNKQERKELKELLVSLRKISTNLDTFLEEVYDSPSPDTPWPDNWDIEMGVLDWTIHKLSELTGGK